jgi:hypothetical protein
VISSAVRIPTGVAMQMGVPVMAGGGYGVAILQASPFLAERISVFSHSDVCFPMRHRICELRRLGAQKIGLLSPTKIGQF